MPIDEDVDELVKKFDGRYEPKHQTEETETKKPVKINTIIIAGIIILIVIFVAFRVDEIRKPIEDILLGKEPVEPTEPLMPSDIQLYKFSDLNNNVSVNVELWLINIGEATATDIEIYIRARNQNGTILLSDLISPTVLVLRDNETCSAIYTVPLSKNETYILHTIEIEWSDGRVSYSKQTNL